MKHAAYMVILAITHRTLGQLFICRVGFRFTVDRMPA